MLKKSITYKDLDDNPVTDVFYFSLSKLELTQLQFGPKQGLEALIKEIISENDVNGILDTFKKIVSLSVGRRSEDNKRFIKSEEIANEFLQTDAYDTLVFELITDADKAVEFIAGVVPAEISAEMLRKQAEDPDSTDSDIRPLWEKEDRKPTSDELKSMTRDEMVKAMQKL